MQVRRIIFIFCSLVLCLNLSLLNAQSNKVNIDSFLNAIQKTNLDTLKTRILLDLAKNMKQYHKLDSAMLFAKQAEAISLRIKNNHSLFSTYLILGQIYYQKEAYDDALHVYDMALTDTSYIDPYEFPRLLASKGNVLIDLNRYEEAIRVFQIAASVHEKNGNKRGLGRVNNSIGVVYQRLENYDKAKYYFLSAQQTAKEINDDELQSTALLNLGTSLLGLKKNKEALIAYQTALEILKGSKNSNRAIAQIYDNIAMEYLSLKNFDSTLLYNARAREIFHNIGDSVSIAISLNILSSIYEEMPMSYISKLGLTPSAIYKLALQFLQRAQSIAIKSGRQDLLSGSYSIASRFHEKFGDHKAALLAYKNYIAIIDSTKGAEIKGNVVRQELKYEYEKKNLLEKANQEKKDLKQKLILSSVLILMILFGIFSLILWKQRNKIKFEQRRSDQLLLNILPIDVADELKQKGFTEARNFENTTVLFTDFVNFTQASETISPKQLIDELNDYFTAFDLIMDKYQMEKIKTIGDAYLAVSGMPQYRQDHAIIAAKAAIEIRNITHEKLKDAGKFDIRIGLHSGNLVAGVIGTKKIAYDIWGDTVNTAARMEASGEPGKINISEATFQLVKDFIPCTYRGQLEAKNKGKISMYFIDA